MSPLRTKMTQDMISRGLATTTPHASLHAVTELSAYDHRSPDTLSKQELHAYLLLEAGTALHTIQRLVGHHSIQTTWRYLQLSRTPLLETRLPLDRLHDDREHEP